MQVYVGLDLGIDTEDNDTLTAAITYDKERSGPEANDSGVFDIRPESVKTILSQ
jgi:hypothetical protein